MPAGVIFRRIGGRIVPIVSKAVDALHTAVIPGKWGKALAARGLRTEIRMSARHELLAAKFKAAVIRKYPSQDMNLREFVVQRGAKFSGARWGDIMRGARGQTWALPRVSEIKKAGDVGAIGVGVTHRDLVTTLHEFGHAQQFREVSRLSRLRFANQGKPLGKLYATLHEADAYLRGAKMAKGPRATRTVLKHGAQRLLYSKQYGPGIVGAATGIGLGAAAGTALIKRRKK